ncbi:hypothetical protein [Streptomyces sp. NPDC002758]
MSRFPQPYGRDGSARELAREHAELPERLAELEPVRVREESG